LNDQTNDWGGESSLLENADPDKDDTEAYNPDVTNKAFIHQGLMINGEMVPHILRSLDLQ